MMNENVWGPHASAALDRELDANETLELLDAMAADADCRAHWHRLREFDRAMAPLVPPATGSPKRAVTGLRHTWWLVPLAAAAILVFGLFLTRTTRVGETIGPPDRQLTVRLAGNRGEMSEAHFVELVVEVLQADPRYQAKMLEVLEEVRPPASLAEAGSPETDPRRAERLALAVDDESARRNDELPWPAVAGIH